ncbi:MAG TPA: hypothetical protein VGR27_04460 [Longimicrobiaceae bacterium]|nr:hypothetical protein [Longimicrobiaceae bacterium]
MCNRGTKLRGWSRAALLAGVLAAPGVLTGCEDWLSVTNPGAIEPPALENPTNIQLMVDGVIGDFQPAFAWTALWSGVFTDELRNHHTFFENPEIDRRDISETNGTYTAAVYNGLHRARFLADSVSTRLKVLLADSASRDLRLAQVLGYAGYTYVLLGEQYCETPLNLSAPVPSEELLRMAAQRFEEAIPVAMAARAAAAAIAPATAASRRTVATADSIANFARVGAARAYLNLGNMAKAVEFASAVTPTYQSPSDPGFQFWAWYLEGATFGDRRRHANPFWEFISAGGSWFSISGTPFLDLVDPRVPHSDTPVGTADGTRQFVPRSPPSFSTYDGTLEGAPFEATSAIRVASALEARYIIAEAQGNTAANVAFVNERRAIGGQLPLESPTEAEYMAALRDQRRRDFYLDGHRMGDLRRYERLYSVDLWPKGSYFGSTAVQYGDQTCWPVPLAEKINNPNYR